MRRGNRLGPGERIRRGFEYGEVYENARSFHGRYCVVFLLFDEKLRRAAGFVAGRKVGGAVERNRARRLLRESYRSLKQRLPEKGIRLVFVAKAACAKNSLKHIVKEMGELLNRAGVL